MIHFRSIFVFGKLCDDVKFGNHVIYCFLYLLLPDYNHPGNNFKYCVYCNNCFQCYRGQQ